MSEILTIRLPDGEKAQWEKAAASVKETVAEYVRKSVRTRAQTGGKSPWQAHLGSIDVSIPAPTNSNIRSVFSQRGRKKR